MKSIKLLAVFAAACLVAGVGFFYSGLYNIGADQPHWPITVTLMEILREQSIDAHAKGMEVPALDNPRLVAEGAEHYSAMCSHCHLAPGMEDTEIRAGLYPQPPNLAEPRQADGGGDAGAAAVRQFWIIKHGIKLTAMPAWGTTHDDQSIWALVAFVRKLPELSAVQYRTMTANTQGAESGSHDHGTDNGHSHDSEETGQPHTH